jgi:muramoyltetrapeptide carboxypeptidase
MNLNFLKKGDVVDVISTGTACTFDELEKIKNFIKKIGLKPNIFLEKKLALKKAVPYEFPSFAAEIRFKQFKKAAENPDSKIIWCARGGYGTAEILPFLQQLKKPKTKKIFIGFSDISSLNKFLIDKWNWQVITAPMLAQIALNKVSQNSIKAIVDLIFGRKKELKYELNHLTTHDSRLTTTQITGGCLSVLAGHFGTKNQIDWNKKILFLEDEGEDGERLDRYFNQLIQIIFETKKYPSAILLGNFLESNNHGTPKAKNIELAIKKFAKNLIEKNLKIPLFEEKSKCLGHSKNIMPLILGGEAKITEDKFLIQKI